MSIGNSFRPGSGDSSTFISSRTFSDSTQLREKGASQRSHHNHLNGGFERENINIKFMYTKFKVKFTLLFPYLVCISLSSSILFLSESMGEQIRIDSDDSVKEKKQQSNWRLLRWIPTSTDHIIDAEKRLLSLVKTKYTTEQVNIGSGPPGSKIRWFRSASNEPRFINTVTFDNNDENAPTMVLVHGYGASQGFFFRNFDALANRFRVVAIDQLGWGGSSRPDFTCKSTEETEAWFIDSFEEWRKAKNLTNFILLGHSLGGYIASKYALKHPEHVRHLILVGPAGFTKESEHSSEQFLKFKSSWKGALANHIWESNFTPQKLVRGLGPWGRNLVNKYTGARFGSYSQGNKLTEDESKLLSDYVYHTLAAKASGELCLKYVFSFGAFARKPLLESASDWKVPTTFIYGFEDWMNYQGAVQAREQMKVPCQIIRVPQGGHFVFIDNPKGFHDAVIYACDKLINNNSSESVSLPEDLTVV